MKKPHIRSAKTVKPSASSSLTPDTFKQAMLGARRLFATKGIKSKADAYQLINQGFAEKRFNEGDVRALQHAITLVFDDKSYGLAQTLLNAKDKGLKLAAEKRAAMRGQTTGAPPEMEKPPPAPVRDKEEAKMRNRARYASNVEPDADQAGGPSGNAADNAPAQHVEPDADQAGGPSDNDADNAPQPAAHQQPGGEPGMAGM